MKSESTSFNIRIELDTLAVLKEYAKENDLTLAQVVRRAVKQFVASEGLVGGLEKSNG